MTDSDPQCRIAILANPQLVHGRNVLRGASRYIRQHAMTAQVDLLTPEQGIQGRELSVYDGIITGLEEPMLKALPPEIPVVRLDEFIDGEAPHELALPHREIGRLAAKALCEYGVVSYGYYDAERGDGEQCQLRSAARMNGFRAEVEAVTSPLIPFSFEVHTHGGYDALVNWLRDLPKPAGVFTFNDLGALQVAEACRLSGISVPEEIAIVGMDNDQLLCMLAQPFITSIDPGTEAIAYDAMRLLIQRLGLPLAEETLVQLSEPVIHLRESTGRDSCQNPTVREALDLIAHLDVRDLAAKAIAKQTAQSLRGLELLFKEHLQSTVQQQIIEERVRRMKHLLRSTNRSVERICELLGQDVANMRRNFIQISGVSPSDYRSWFRGRPERALELPKSDVSDARISVCFLNGLRGQAGFEFLRGAELYVRNRPDVQLALHVGAHTAHRTLEYQSASQPPFDSYDGFIAAAEVDMPKEIIGRRPIVYFDHQREHTLAMSVLMDNYEAGVMAAKHYLEKGYKEFAYCDYGDSTTSVSDQAEDRRSDARYQGFVETLQSAGIPEQNVWRGAWIEDSVTAAWLYSLPKRTALLAFNDPLAVLLLSICHRGGLDVPQDLALLGVDDDVFLCNRSQPSLSSINVCFQKMGFRAMEELVAVIEGKAPPAEPIVVLPRIVVERESSAALAFHHPGVEKAAAFIRRHYDALIGIDQIVQVSGVSRRTLETHFKSLLGLSPRAYLELERIHAAKDLLSLTDLSVEEIAQQVGFARGSYLSQVFKDRVGESPLAYRKHRSDLP